MVNDVQKIWLGRRTPLATMNPTAQKTFTVVRRYWCEPGRKSSYTFVSDSLRNRQVIQKVGSNLGGGPSPQGRCLHNKCLVSSHFPQEETIGLPPTPIPTNATNKASAMKLFAPPAATPNAPPINSVMLNAYLKRPP